MVKISVLTKEEKEYVCEKIPIGQIKIYFQKNPKAFAEIKPGFRPDKLSDADSVSILKKNIEKPFISSFIEKTISSWLEEIADYRKKLEEDGYSEGEALLKTLPDSYFCDNCSLYFKLTDINSDESYVELFKDALSLIDKTKNDSELFEEQHKAKEKINENEIIIQNLNDSLKKKEEELVDLHKDYDEKIKELAQVKEENSQNKEELEQASIRLSEAESAIKEIRPELERYKYLESYEDSEYEDTNRYQHISIGLISHDFSGTPWINRLADVVDGTIRVFRLDENSPRFFDNRDRLYWKDGPDEDGEIGVWGWRADPRDTDPSKDYVVSEFQEYARIIEVIEFQNCHSITELSKVITDKFDNSISCEKILFVCNSINGMREGLLCNLSDFESVGGQYRLLPSIFTLRKYALKDSDIIEINGRLFYHKMNLGIPQSVVRIRSPFEVVKKIVLKRAKVTSFRDQGLSIKEAQHCVNYLKELHGDTLIQEISEAYDCKETEAKVYLEEFMNQAETCLNGEDLDNSTLSAIISKNPELTNNCKELLKEEWNKEHEETIKHANEELKEIQDEFNIRKGENEALNLKLEEIQKSIKENEKLAEDVEIQVEQKIEEARNKAADFISQMAFVRPQVDNGTANRESGALDWIITENEFDFQGTIDDVDTFEEELAENIIRSGYEDNTSIEMAQVISFCIINDLPIVVREHAKVIADCVSGVLGNNGIFEICIPITGIDNKSISRMFEMAFEKGYNTILVHGVFDGYSNSTFNSILRQMRVKNHEICVILSIQGINPGMLSSDIWNHSFYIDGDYAFQGLKREKLFSFNLSTKLERDIDDDEYKQKWKSLKSIDYNLSNTSKSNYSKYLAIYGLTIGTSMAIQMQLMIVAQAQGNEKEMKEIIAKEGFLLEGQAW